jgi:hypothetical protein
MTFATCGPRLETLDEVWNSTPGFFGITVVYTRYYTVKLGLWGTILCRKMLDILPSHRGPLDENHTRR